MQATVASPQQLADLLGALSMHINRTSSPDVFRVLSELDISFTQMKALFALDEHEERSLKALAEQLSMSLAAMSRSVDGLVRHGYVTRRECAADRRSRLIALLPKGEEAIRRLLAAREAALVVFAAELGDAERTALRDALLPIAERIASP